MSPENLFLCHAFLAGFYFFFLYDILRVLRRVIPHNGFFLSLEDLCFWLYCAVYVFLLMYRESNGTIRWFAVFGAMCGMLFYKKLFSAVFVKYMTRLLKSILSFVGRGLRFLLKPVYRVACRISRRGRMLVQKRLVRRLKEEQVADPGSKKALTLFTKMLRMNVKGSDVHGSRKKQKGEEKKSCIS